MIGYLVSYGMSGNKYLTDKAPVTSDWSHLEEQSQISRNLCRERGERMLTYKCHPLEKQLAIKVNEGTLTDLMRQVAV